MRIVFCFEDLPLSIFHAVQMMNTFFRTRVSPHFDRPLEQIDRRSDTVLRPSAGNGASIEGTSPAGREPDSVALRWWYSENVKP